MTTPFLCVFITFLLIYFPRILVVVATVQSGQKVDNNHPRDQQAKLEGWGRRAQAAHNNAFEDFAPFAASVVVAHLAHADPGKSSLLAIAHVVVRLAYPLIYVADIGALRTAVWSLGLLSTAGLFVLAYL